METKVIGIDPAPTKETTVFDGDDFKNYEYKGLIDFIEKLKKENEKVLICWDAPLSFSIENQETPFSKRPIEKFFSQKNWMKTPSGISVMGYSSCPHWMISQYIVGYPQANQFFNSFNPPFELIFDNSNFKHAITEVHPAVALWLWCRDVKKGKKQDWSYKKHISILDELVEILKKKEIIPKDRVIKNDDELDAFIARKLGKMWLENKVECLGNNETGAFLIPKNEKLQNKFKEFKY
jgi:predicted RNase H-like nuclease